MEFLKKLKEQAVFIFKEASFELHKWHSNVKELEDQNSNSAEHSSTFAKQKFESKDNETKLLGLPWDKEPDTLSIPIPEKESSTTKRGVLKFLAAVYDVPGMMSPVFLLGKNLFRDICDAKLAWDEPLSGDLMKRWMRFLEKLPKEKVTFPRSIIAFREDLDFIDFHAFSDASNVGVAAVVYAVIHQNSGVSQGLVTSKARLSKKGHSIPRLELIACHMAVNLLKM